MVSCTVVNVLPQLVDTGGIVQAHRTENESLELADSPVF